MFAANQVVVWTDDMPNMTGPEQTIGTSNAGDAGSRPFAQGS